VQVWPRVRCFCEMTSFSGPTCSDGKKHAVCHREIWWQNEGSMVGLVDNTLGLVDSTLVLTVIAHWA